MRTFFWKTIHRHTGSSSGSKMIDELNAANNKNCKKTIIFSYLKISPSLAMAYSILGKGNKAPISEALNPQRAPTAMMYLAHAAPRIANTSGSALLSANWL